MKSDESLDALFTAARANAPETERAAYAFETRVLARIREERGGSLFAWAWRLSPFLAALAIAAAVWCRGYTGIDADPTYALDAVQDGGKSALVAWLAEDDR